MREAKFIKLADSLSEEILSGKLSPGSPLPSQHQTASQYNLSRSCVQKALDILNERGLVEKRPGVGVFVRKNSKKVKSLKSALYLLPEDSRATYNSSDNFGPGILWGVEEGTRICRAVFMLRRCNPGTDIQNIAATVRELNPSGVIINRDLPDEIIRNLRPLGIPLVTVGRIPNISGIGSVTPNYSDAVFQMLLRLKENGIKKAVIFYPGNHYYSHDLYAGFEAFKKENDSEKFLAVDFFANIPSYAANLEMEHTRKALMKIIRAGELPQVLLFASDWTALGAISTLSENGIKVPENIGVIGMLGLEAGLHSSPPLTTLSLNSFELGRKAVEMLSGMLTENTAPTVERIPFEYIERESFRFGKSVS